jgi:hypothetical protein
MQISKNRILLPLMIGEGERAMSSGSWCVGGAVVEFQTSAVKPDYSQVHLQPPNQ